MNNPHSLSQLSRRNFLKSAGCLTIGFSLMGYLPSTREAVQDIALPGSLRNHPKINAWLEILENGNVRILTGKMELGQGLRVVMRQAAAEELDLTPDNVEVILAETGRTPNEGYTAGSRSVESSAMSVRYAAASAREKLIELAAEQSHQPAEKLEVINGKVSAKDGSASWSFNEVLKNRQIEDEVTLPVKLKPKDKYKWVGKAVQRTDIEQMVRGGQVYVHDLRFPGMAHARVVRPPSYQAKLAGFASKNVEKMPGVQKIIVNGSFLGVIANEEYQAVKAQAFLKENAQWTGFQAMPEVDSWSGYIKTLPANERLLTSRGNGATGPVRHKAAYVKPYIMHGSIGPSCAVALYNENQLHIWSHSQGVYPLRESLAAMTGLTREQIHIIGTPGSGCYGHNGADDVAADAALLALSFPEKHVRLQWSREDEHSWEPYGSVMLMEPEASLDSDGKIVDWRYDLWSDSHSTRPGGDPASLLPARYLEKPFQPVSEGYRGGANRNAEPYYDLSSIRITAHYFQGPLRVSALRSLGAYANVFAIESFMDELAEKAGHDPLAFRIRHLTDIRAVEVIKKIEEMTRNERAAANEGIGYGFSRYKNSAAYCAIAAKVAVNNSEQAVKPIKMWAAIDAGETMNPDGLKNQTEGGMIQAASWTLLEEVAFGKDGVTSVDWAGYPIFRFGEIPETEVAVIDRPSEPPLGAGEAAQGPAGAAIANAVYKASGVRVRETPIARKLFEGKS